MKHIFNTLIQTDINVIYVGIVSRGMIFERGCSRQAKENNENTKLV